MVTFLNAMMTMFALTMPSINNSSSLSAYIKYLNHYNKQYNSSEFWTRYSIYENNTNYIGTHNNTNYTLGVNRYTDMSRAEFRSIYFKKTIRPHSRVVTQKLLKNTSHPDAVDWRANGWVTNVKDQQQCGSCWAFSAIGAIEGQHANATGKLVSLSEQDLVDCSYNFGNEGCGGGWPEAAMRYVIKQGGVDTESSYPYKAADETCTYSNTTIGSTVVGTVNVTTGDMNALYHAITHIGPISVAIDAEADFQFYSSGIFTSTSCSNEYLDHAVLAVGFGITETNKSYIIVKNSWSTDWGMNGYIYMSADIPNMCGIASVASYPLVSSTEH
jgi:cathepsin L